MALVYDFSTPPRPSVVPNPGAAEKDALIAALEGALRRQDTQCRTAPGGVRVSSMCGCEGCEAADALRLAAHRD